MVKKLVITEPGVNVKARLDLKKPRVVSKTRTKWAPRLKDQGIG